MSLRKISLSVDNECIVKCPQKTSTKKLIMAEWKCSVTILLRKELRL